MASSQSSTTAAQPGWSFTAALLVEFLAVGLFTVFAGFSDDMGRLMLIFMWGLVIGWMLLHTSNLASMVKAL